MIVAVEHTKAGVYCTSCGALVGDEHTVSSLATCFYVARRFPAAMKVLAGEADRPKAGLRSGFGLSYRGAA